MKLELFHLIKRLSSRTRPHPTKNVTICQGVSTFEGALGLDNGALLRLALPLGGFLNTPLSPPPPTGDPAAHLQQIACLAVQFGHHLWERHGGLVERERLILGQRRQAGPGLLSGGAQQFKDPLQLVIDVRAREQRPAGVSQLCGRAGQRSSEVIRGQGPGNSGRPALASSVGGGQVRGHQRSGPREQWPAGVSQLCGRRAGQGSSEVIRGQGPGNSGRPALASSVGGGQVRGHQRSSEVRAPGTAAGRR